MGKMIELSVGGKVLPVYEAEPSGETKGGIILIHEVWGLVEHTLDLADRYAKEGYFVIAPNLLSNTGITKELVGDLQEEMFDPERRSNAQTKFRKLMAPIQAPSFGEDTLMKLMHCYDYLEEKSEVVDRIAAIGHCFGGTYSYSLAVNEPGLKAVVPYYGHADFTVKELSKIKSPILAFYGANDTGLISGLPELKDKMAEAGVDYTVKVYEYCGHAFFNDTNRFTYNEAAAKDAWKLTLKFLADNLV